MRKLIVLLVLFATQYVVAQTPLITGRVTNNNGEPVSFATVKIKGTDNSVAADVDGVFKIKASPGQVLVFTAANFAPREVAVGSQTTLSVKMQLAQNTLSEVVVTALGQQVSKNKVGYATTTFSTAQINKDAPVGMLDGLMGKVAGADISNTGGPGSSTKVVLRGFGVISGGTNQPLYVIDGVPLSDAQFQNNTNQAAAGNPFTNTQDFGNGMSDINPNDIESITVLKGTAASSLYGGLAKNGAIMITTKKGRAGKLKVEYDGSFNLSYVGKLPTYQSEFGQGWGGVFVLSENGSWGPRLDGKQHLWGSIVDNSQLLKPFSFVKNNVRSFFETGTELNNTLALSGGNDVTRFYFSYGNVSSNGIVPSNADYLERNTFALRTNSSFGKFSINTSFNYVNRKVNAVSAGQPGADGGGIFQALLQIPVDIPIKDFRDYKNKFFSTDGYFSPYAENPYFTVFENGNTQASDRFFGNLNSSYKFSSHLSAEVRIGGDFTNSHTKTWKQRAYPTPGSWTSGNNVEGAPRAPDVGSVSQGADNFSIINGDLLFKYNQDLSDNFSLDALVGGNYYQSRSQSELTGITNLTIPGFYNLSNTSLPPLTTDASLLQRRMGVYAQATIGFKSQLYLTGNIRNDWSSTLPINKNTLLYPGANVSWVASELLPNHATLSYLKFHAAYGRTGSDPAPYLVYPSLAPGAIALPFGTLNTPFNGVSGFSVNPVVGNANLKPILTDELEVGTEFRLLHDRIGAEVTVYDKKTKGQIFAIPVAPSTGYTNVVENLGVVTDKGIEVTLNARPVESPNFSWSFTYTFARNWNKVNSLSSGLNNDDLYGIQGGPNLFAVVGKSSTSIYAPVPQKTPDGKLVVDPNTGFPIVNSTVDKDGFSLGYFGSGEYDYTMGWSNTFTIMQNFSLGFSLDFRYGGVMYSQTANQVLFDGNGIITTYNDRRPFIVPNSVNAVQDGSGKTTYVENKTFVGPGSLALGGVGHGQTDYTYGYYYPSFNHGSGNGFNIFDKSFLKLRDANISYNLPRAWANQIKASNASFGVYARNILLWTPISNQYVDPEASNVSNDIKGAFGEYAGVPLAKSFGAILRITF